MKKLSKILLRISGFYYLLLSIALMLSTLFSLFVDRKYIFAIFDLLGFSNISINLIKPIFFIMLLCLFILISLLTKRIFSSIKDKKHLLSNMFAGFFFLFLSILAHVFLRDRIFIISYIFNIFLIMGSMLGLKEKSEDYYDNKESITEDNNGEDIKKVDDEAIMTVKNEENNDKIEDDDKDDIVTLKDVKDKKEDENLEKENQENEEIVSSNEETKTDEIDENEDNSVELEDVEDKDNSVILDDGKKESKECEE